MKRTIQGLLVTSVLLVGCAGSNTDSTRTGLTTESPDSAREIAGIHQNLTGICTAITRYGLPLDGQTRHYLRRRARTLDQLIGASGIDANGTVHDLARRFDRCDPVTAAEIRALNE